MYQDNTCVDMLLISFSCNILSNNFVDSCWCRWFRKRGRCRKFENRKCRWKTWLLSNQSNMNIYVINNYMFLIKDKIETIWIKHIDNFIMFIIKPKIAFTKWMWTDWYFKLVWDNIIFSLVLNWLWSCLQKQKLQVLV